MSKPKSQTKPEARVSTPAPSRDEAQVLPGFPITWTPIGVCMEMVEEDFSYQNLVDLVNKLTLPCLNVVVVNAQELAEQEVRANTDLGSRLKSAKQEFNEKKKNETNQQSWMPPSLLLLELLNGKVRQGIPEVTMPSTEERGTLQSMIRTNGQFSVSLVQIYRKVKKLKEALLRDAHINTQEILQLEESLQSISDCQYMELFPDMVIADVYSKAKLNRPFEKLVYDEMEDCIMSVLYAADGEYEWKHSIPCQIPFGDFCEIHEDLRSFRVDSRSYALEEHKSQVIERKHFYLSEGGGLFSCALPSLYKMSKEPQGTLYMDGNTYILRSTRRGSNMVIELYICFEDGLNVCFFLAQNGSVSLQVSNPNGTTVEMDSRGFIYMCSTYMAFESQMTCETTKEEKVHPLQTKCNDDIGKSGNVSRCIAKKFAEEEKCRCILPSGSVICCKRNGELVALFCNGNISEYKSSNMGCCKWITTNSKGYQVLQNAYPAGNTKLDGGQEISRIKDLIKKELMALIQRTREKEDKYQAERLADHNRSLHKRSHIVCKHLLKGMLNLCGPRKSKDKEFFHYFSCEEGLQALLAGSQAQEQQQSGVEVEGLEEIVQAVLHHIQSLLIPCLEWEK